MEDTVTKLNAFYDDIMSKADPRVEGFFMMSSPLSSLVVCLVYVFVVEVALPRFMEKRRPLELRNLMIVYNFAMVALSGYIFMEFALSGWFAGYSLQCQPVDYSKSYQAIRIQYYCCTCYYLAAMQMSLPEFMNIGLCLNMEMVNACWWFYFSKFLELFDTVFFVLRKKYNQVSFLHVFHHGIMPVSWWFGVKFVPGGFGTFHAWLNSFIHFVMYIYYGMSAMGPRYQKYLWWKKYMTSMQITQFLLVCIHTSQLFFIDCNYPILFAYWIGSYAVVFLFLFADFYVKSYRKPAAASDKPLDDVQRNGFTRNGVKKLK